MPRQQPAVTIRPARRDDVLAIQRIYNHEVLHSLATFDEAPWSTEHRLAWLEQQRGELVLVAVGERSVVGFAQCIETCMLLIILIFIQIWK